MGCGKTKRHCQGVWSSLKVLMKVQSFSGEHISYCFSCMSTQTWRQDGDRNSYEQHLLFRQNPYFSGGQEVACYRKTKGGKHVQNFLFWTGPYEVMSYKGLGAGRWEHFPLWDTWPGNAWPGPVCVIYENNLSFQVGAVWFNSSSQLMLSTGEVCGLFCHP